MGMQILFRIESEQACDWLPKQGAQVAAPEALPWLMYSLHICRGSETTQMLMLHIQTWLLQFGVRKTR